MFRDSDNTNDSKKNSLKDTSSQVPASTLGGPAQYQNTGIGSVSYTKTDKLITALYMVTDIVDKDEPLRNKLRTLGVEILSDMHSVQQNNVGQSMSFIGHKISELMSFLNIAADLNIISEMNCNILRKEFSELNQALKNSVSNIDVLNKRVDLTEFFTETPILDKEDNGRWTTAKAGVQRPANGHRTSTSLGVQNKNTLLHALKQIETSYSKINHNGDVFDVLKKQRRESIIYVIKNISGGATIKDIKDMAKTMPDKANSIISCSEKTLQRELVSMVKDNVLERMGEKRWSKYFLR
jgi:DNA-binding HxlR family transcriptional regulator